MDVNAPWMRWAQELQSIAQCGLAYARDVYDVERYERIREISAEMLSHQTEIPLARVKEVFCNETGYQTPKLDPRAAIIEDGRILLVQERDGLWSLPGGWVDVDQSIRGNTIKEVREEAGLEVLPLRLIALHDRNRHNRPAYIHGICKVFVLCQRLGGQFQPNSETVASGFFTQDALPPLAESKNTVDQIRLCFCAWADPNWPVVFD